METDLNKIVEQIVEEKLKAFRNDFKTHMEAPFSKREWLTTKDLKSLTGLSNAQLRDLRKSGALPYAEKDNTNIPLVARADYEAWSERLRRKKELKIAAKRKKVNQ